MTLAYINYLMVENVEHPKSTAEINQLKALIAEGNRLKNLPEFNNIFQTSEPSGLTLPMAFSIDNWLKEAITLIYSLLPNKIIDSDFPGLAAIHGSCLGQNQIITSDSKENINVVINTLTACLNFFEWLIAFDGNNLNSWQKANFYFGPLEASVLYLQKEFIPLLVGIEDGRTRKTTLLHLYGRIFSVTHGIVKLNDIRSCQLLTASLRILLELYIDMSLIVKNLVHNDIEKFFSFSETYKIRSAKNLIRIDKELQRPIEKSSALENYLVNAEQITQKAHRLWKQKPNHITHWTNLHLEERARKANELEMYRDVYYYGNMFVHSGYIDIGKAEDDAHLLCSHVYSIALEIFKQSTELICDEVATKQKGEILQEITGIHLFFGYFQVWKSLIETQRK